MRLTQQRLDEVQSQLYSAVLCDVMDDLGLRNQSMRHNIRSLEEDDVLVGHAMTLLAVDVYSIPTQPYQLELEAIDSLQPGDVVVTATNQSTRSGFWGELLSTAAQVRGCRGAVIDGFTRDGRSIKEMNWPVFATGCSPADSKGRTDAIAFRVPIACGDVIVQPGDLIFGDGDGVVVVPNHAIEVVLQKALDKVKAENVVRDELRKGHKVVEVFRKYGIL